MRSLLTCTLGGALALLGYWVGRASVVLPAPELPAICLPCEAPDLSPVMARLDHLDARCVLLPEWDRLAVASVPKKAVP